MADNKYYDATNVGTETKGAVVNGILRKALAAAATITPKAGDPTSVTIANDTAIGVGPKAKPAENGVYPLISQRPPGVKVGKVYYDPSLDRLVNNVTGRRSSPQGEMRFIGGRDWKDLGTGRIYKAIADARN